ncbi:MAG TPA: prolipoprotein diacylglyceryl transferase [Panacibacter sp.]|nr:prolipoprotein diacylglyceryl transferase [Panacibacter sp.]
MYPNLFYLFKDIFGIEIPFLKVVNTFGFFVAIAFLVSAWVLAKELKRKEALRQFSYTEATITVGKPAAFDELFINFILGFTLGFKILGVMFVPGALDDPQAFIFSLNGSWSAGLLLGIFFTVLKWREKNKEKLAKPETRKIRIWPSDRVGDITIIAAVGGLVGAKIFDNLENWDRFIQDPVGNLFSPSGLTFYGGLIVATLSLWFYFHKKGIKFIKVADAAGPVLMLSYGLGRIGCQVSGDGDWGIPNYQMNPYSWLPDWMWAYDYPHNVAKEGMSIPGCDWGDYCNHLIPPVYPTPFYEIVISLILFFVLWSLRKKIKTTGRVFAIYLMLNGIERFFIEKIRVNTKYDIFGFHPTQAEIISTLLFITGMALYLMAPKLWISEENKASTSNVSK